MRFWRSLGYVARRLGREFLILALIVVALYVAVDQYLFYRFQKTLEAWAERYAEVFPAAAFVNTGEGCAALDKLEVALEELEAEAEKPAWAVTPAQTVPPKILPGLPSDQTLMKLNMDLFANDEPVQLMERPLDVAEIDQILAARVVALAPAVEEAIACGPFQWPPGAIHGPPARFLRLCEMLRLHLAMSLVLAHDGKADDCTELLIRSGRLLAKLSDPRESVYPTILRQWYLTAVETALAREAITAEGIDPLIAALAATRATLPPPHSNMHPESFVWEEIWSGFVSNGRNGHPFVARFLRPLLLYQLRSVLETNLLLSETYVIERASERAAAIRAIAQEGKSSVELLGVQRDYMFFIVRDHEEWLTEFDILGLMLTLEQHRFDTGAYPSAIEPITDFIPPEVPAHRYTDPPIEYTPDENQQGYRLRRETPEFTPPDTRVFGANLKAKRVWVRRAQDSD